MRVRKIFATLESEQKGWQRLVHGVFRLGFVSGLNSEDFIKLLFDSQKTMSEYNWIWGCIASVVGSTFSNLGIFQTSLHLDFASHAHEFFSLDLISGVNVQKFSAMKNALLPLDEQKSYCRQPCVPSAVPICKTNPFLTESLSNILPGPQVVSCRLFPCHCGRPG